MPGWIKTDAAGQLPIPEGRGLTNAMLRIDVHQEKEVTTIVLAGKLAGAWVAELERCWDAAVSAESCHTLSSTQPIRVDLSEVTFVDERGKQLVAQMCQSGIQLAGTGLIAGFICNEIKETARKCRPVEEDGQAAPAG